MNKLSALFHARRRSLGDKGERFAARWLRRHGYRILHHKYRIGDDEADLIVLDPNGRTIVIVEVKTRSNDQPPPEASIDRKKQFRLARLAARLAKRPSFRDRPLRFDAIGVVWPDHGKPQIKHFVAAFESPF
ncbi:MAG: YraN family protein [Planctomycetes bacterium]|nr:YraN family protein [Planctomycetota bacterium]